MSEYAVYEIRTNGTEKWIGNVTAETDDEATELALEQYGAPINVVREA